MSAGWAAGIALGICVLAAVAEGVCAGAGVRAYFAQLRLPRFSPPLWTWYLIGVLYYAACFVALYRTLLSEADTLVRGTAVALAVAVMAVNALWNFVFFRARKLALSLLLFAPYALLVLAWLLCLWQLDAVAAWCLVPYAVYLVYATAWCYALWRCNRRME